VARRALTPGARGLATEGARVALDFAFLALGRERVISVIQPANAALIRVAEISASASSAWPTC
jgi:hypothetical protein